VAVDRRKSVDTARDSKEEIDTSRNHVIAVLQRVDFRGGCARGKRKRARKSLSSSYLIFQKLRPAFKFWPAQFINTAA
jgi:hypothetical protein